ncbi:hypothetical protein FH972_024650 [Carpinus fangiana]|uniref:Uncharacterized protein n=1 Tax=Carpinus fangiana TaxID=176857 RepID=A0A5N6KYL4_9ROSI|nr:hypothetical protein FH972_024650 [Carpinus fangiana]
MSNLKTKHTKVSIKLIGNSYTGKTQIVEIVLKATSSAKTHDPEKGRAVREGRDGACDVTGAAGAGAGIGGLGAVGDGVIAQQLGQGASGLLAEEQGRGLGSAGLHISVGDNVEEAAVLHNAGVVGASLDGLLQEAFLPSLLEVTVITKTGWVAVGDDKLASLASELLGVPDGLEEDRGCASLKALRASATHDLVGVRHMALVVGRINILAVPAGGEHELETNTVLAFSVKEVLLGKVVTAKGRLGCGAVVQAVETNSLLAESRLSDLKASPVRLGRLRLGASEVAAVVVTRNHLETLGKGLDVVAVKKVVRKHTTGLADLLEIAVGVAEVEVGGPVGRLVLTNLARGAVGVGQEVGRGGGGADG